MEIFDPGAGFVDLGPNFGVWVGFFPFFWIPGLITFWLVCLYLMAATTISTVPLAIVNKSAVLT